MNVSVSVCECEGVCVTQLTGCYSYNVVNESINTHQLEVGK